MSDDTFPAPPATAAAPQESWNEVISPTDMRVYRVRSSQLAAYKQAGYVDREPDTGIKRAAIQKHFSSWMDTPEELGIAMVGGVPFANKLITGMSTAENAKAWAERVKEVEDDHPYVNFAGNVLGSGLAISGGVALAGAAGLGAGAAGVGAAAEAAGAGFAGAEGALGTAAAIGKGAAGVAGAVGETAGLATGGKSLAGLALKGAAGNVALGGIARFDHAAIMHAMSPEGQEKSAFDLDDVMLDAALGGGFSLAGKAIGKTLKGIGKWSENKALSAGVKSISKVYETDAGIKQGIGDTDRMVMEAVFKAGPKNAKRKASDMTRVLGDKMEQIKIDLGNTRLSDADLQDMWGDVKELIGGTPALKRSMHVISDGNFDMAHLMKIRETIYKQVVWNQMDQDPMYQAADLAGQRVTKALHSMLEKHDLTTGATRAQQQVTLDKEYMSWQRLKALIIPAPPDEIEDILRNVAGKAAMGTGIGTALGAMGLSATGASIGFGTAAGGLEAARTIKPYHVTKMAYHLSRYMQAADIHMTKAIEAGLYGAPAQLHNVTDRRSYMELASKAQAVAANPVESMANLHKAHVENGTPEEMAENIVPRQHAKMMHLAELMPKRADAADFATNSHGDPVQQHRWVGQVRTAQDPTYGLLYPTKTNMEINKKFHPLTLYKAQQAIIEQIRTNPNLPARSRAWASRVLERPVGNLNSPRFSQMLREARAKKQAEEQQAAKPSGSRGTTVQSEGGSGTRLDSLQGGG